MTLSDHEFGSGLFSYHVTTLGKLFTHVIVTMWYNLTLVKGQCCPEAGKLLAVLAEIIAACCWVYSLYCMWGFLCLGFLCVYRTSTLAPCYRFDRLLRDVTICLVGKYTRLQDSYASVIKALSHAAMACNYKLDLKVCVLTRYCLISSILLTMYLCFMSWWWWKLN